MKKEFVNKSEIKLIGLKTRTNNKNEMDPKTSKIGKLAGHFWSQSIASKISNRKNPGVTLAVYTQYESDEHGEYTYFIGEEVTTLEHVPAELHTLNITSAQYLKFTTPSGKMPEVVIQAWQQIWKMTPKDFGGKRAYQADFEVYDERAQDPENTSIDIYIGIK
ncbi:MAG: GyrI-like domain-containing protein [Gammaproteobacteria bacterium]|nr:GyrI-like domain-containing protein [Gammaproteobacteria bacterium]